MLPRTPGNTEGFVAGTMAKAAGRKATERDLNRRDQQERDWCSLGFGSNDRRSPPGLGGIQSTSIRRSAHRCKTWVSEREGMIQCNRVKMGDVSHFHFFGRQNLGLMVKNGIQMWPRLMGGCTIQGSLSALSNLLLSIAHKPGFSCRKDDVDHMEETSSKKDC